MSSSPDDDGRLFSFAGCRSRTLAMRRLNVSDLAFAALAAVGTAPVRPFDAAAVIIPARALSRSSLSTSLATCSRFGCTPHSIDVFTRSVYSL